MRVTIRLGHARYPERLLRLSRPPGELTISGDIETRARRIAIVGARDAAAKARDLARELAAEVTRGGGVVLSGGARGVDEAAHRGALAAGGPTWVVAPSGPDGCYPKEHEGLFAEIEASLGCAVIWPFAPGTKPWTPTFLERNRVLAALADEVVVVQASHRSGALGTAAAATKLGRPVWAVTAPPWLPGFEGGTALVLRGAARPVVGVPELLTSMLPDQQRLPMTSHDPPPQRPTAPRVPEPALSERARTILAVLTTDPQHLENIAERSDILLHLTSNELLTLSLGNVVVEGPPGWFRLAVLS